MTESTAQYWRPVWEALEQRPQRRAGVGAARTSGTLHLAQAQSNRRPRGRKEDFPDAERLVKRPGHPLRGKGASRQRGGEEGARSQDDPASCAASAIMSSSSRRRPQRERFSTLVIREAA